MKTSINSLHKTVFNFPFGQAGAKLLVFYSR